MVAPLDQSRAFLSVVASCNRTGEDGSLTDPLAGAQVEKEQNDDIQLNIDLQVGEYCPSLRVI